MPPVRSHFNLISPIFTIFSLHFIPPFLPHPPASISTPFPTHLYHFFFNLYGLLDFLSFQPIPPPPPIFLPYFLKCIPNFFQFCTISSYFYLFFPIFTPSRTIITTFSHFCPFAFHFYRKIPCLPILPDSPTLTPFSIHFSE